MPSTRSPSIRTLDALLGGTWAWDEDDDDDTSSSPTTSPAKGESDRESPSAAH